MSAMGCGSSCKRETSVSCDGVALRDLDLESIFKYIYIPWTSTNACQG